MIHLDPDSLSAPRQDTQSGTDDRPWDRQDHSTYDRPRQDLQAQEPPTLEAIKDEHINY